MSKELIEIRQVAKVIRVIRGEKVLLDFDLAPLYGVTTGNLNKAMRRNRERFPSDFMFQLTAAEAESLIFQFGRAKGRGGRRHRPSAFTEQGVAMLSSVWTGERTRLACWRWRPRHRELFQPRFLDKFGIELKESFSTRRRKEHARRVCSPD
jgi:hypothetical protein